MKKKKYGSDDLRVRYGVKENLDAEVVRKKKPGLFSRIGSVLASPFKKIFGYISNLRSVRIIGLIVKKVMDSKIYKILTSKIVGYSLGIALGISSLIFAAPALLPFAAAAFGATVISTVAKIAKDAKKVRDVKKLEKKDALAKEISQSVAVQYNLSKIDPDLSFILEQKNSSNLHESKIDSKSLKGLKLLPRIGAKIYDIGQFLRGVFYLNPLSISTNLLGLVTNAQESRQISRVQSNLKKEISDSLESAGVFKKLSLDSLNELAESEKKKTIALRLLMARDGYFKMSKEEKKSEFEKILSDVKNFEPQISEKELFKQNFRDPRYKDVLDSLNPFKEKYGDGNMVNIKPKNIGTLDKKMREELRAEKEKLKKKIENPKKRTTKDNRIHKRSNSLKL